MKFNQEGYSWSPLTNELRERAENILLSIATQYKDPTNVHNKSINIPHLNIDGFQVERWSDMSLSNGYSGICIFLSELDMLYPQAGWDQIGHLYLQKLQIKIQEDGIRDTSLYGGLAGMLMAVKSLSRGGTRYNLMIDRIASWLEELLMERISLVIKKMRNKNLEISDYDTIVGITGIGRVVLLFYDRPQMKKIWEQIIYWLNLFCGQKNINGDYIPAWQIPSENQFLMQEKKQYPLGNFNLSLSHGISGPLSLMSIAVLQGHSSNELNKSIKNLASWLIQWKIDSEKGIYWPGRVSFEEWKRGNLDSNNTLFQRDSWCYGTPGIARSLWLAGKALGNKYWSSTAFQAYQDMNNRGEENGGLISPTLCHGISGWIHMIQRMYYETGDLTIRELRDKLVVKLLDFYNPTSLFGYCDRNIIKNEIVDIDEAGLLNGAAGVGLVLSSLIRTTSPDWDSILLVN